VSPGLQIREVDPRDDPGFAAFHVAYWSAQHHELGPACAAWTAPELRVALQEPNRRFRQTAYVGVEDGAVVVTGWTGLPLLDNTDSARLEVHVPAASRRRGRGTTMLRHLEHLVREQGRTLLDAEAAWTHDRGPTGAGSPGMAFARSHGYALTLVDVQRELALPVDDALLDELAARAAPHHAAYTLRSWVGAVPDEIALSWMTLSSSLMTEAPVGEKVVESEVVDVAALREGEATVAKQGRTRFNTVALDAAGEVVAYTDLVTTVHEPGRAYQWGTLVRGADRGHRLGLAVKVANLRLLQEASVPATRLTTWNAEVNEHMVGVNDLLGFVPVARLGEFQKRLP
jgi:GNAT superfamily N-acetyltransferase